MRYLYYPTSADAEITLEKLDKVAKTLSDKIKNVAKYFGIFFSWCIFNALVWMFFKSSRTLSLDAFRLITESLRSAAGQDVLLLFTLLFDDKIACFIYFAMALVFGVAFFVCFLNLKSESVGEAACNSYAKYCQSGAQHHAYVVSYKQQVAFIS